MALLVALAAVAGGAAALTVDTETTDTSTTSDIQSTTVITEPHNSSKVQRVEVDGDGLANATSLANPETAFTLRFVVNDSASSQDNDTLYETTANWTETAISSNDNYYHTNVSNEKFGDNLQYGANQTVTVDAQVVFNETESDEAVTNITFSVDPNGTNARIQAGPSETQTSNNTVFGMSIPFLSSDDDPGAAQVNDTVGVESNTSEITVNVADANASDSFAEAANDGSSGDFTPMAYADVNGHTVPVFIESGGAEWLDSDEAYMTVSSDGSTLTVHNANATFDDSTSSVDVKATGNEAYGLRNTRSLLSDYGASIITQMTEALGAADANGNPFEA